MLEFGLIWTFLGKKIRSLRDHHKSGSGPQGRCQARFFSEHFPAFEPQCHTHTGCWEKIIIW